MYNLGSRHVMLLETLNNTYDWRIQSLSDLCAFWIGDNKWLRELRGKTDVNPERSFVIEGNSIALTRVDAEVDLVRIVKSSVKELKSVSRLALTIVLR